MKNPLMFMAWESVVISGHLLEPKAARPRTNFAWMEHPPANHHDPRLVEAVLGAASPRRQNRYETGIGSRAKAASPMNAAHSSQQPAATSVQAQETPANMEPGAVIDIGRTYNGNSLESPRSSASKLKPSHRLCTWCSAGRPPR